MAVLSKLRIEVLPGKEARRFLSEIAALRIKVFREFPYLYEGDLYYERKYLETYLSSDVSRIILCFEQEKLVGVSTVICMEDENESIQAPFRRLGWPMNHLVYFGESLLLPEYRGAGLGKRFFEERLAFARSLTLAKRCVFCAVIRDAEHPMRPKHYQPLDNFWRAMGFQPWDGVKCKLSWKQLGDILETDHELQFWFQDI